MASSAPSDVMYDVMVIGGGVVGCAILEELTKHGYKCILAEKENQLISGASSGNSGIAHTGFDAQPETVEAKLLHENQQLLEQLNISNLPLRKIGAILVAWTSAELLKLPEIERRARSMGVNDIERLTREQVLELEPNLSTRALGGLLIRGEATIDSWLLPVSLAHSAVRNGAHVVLGYQILSGKQQADGTWLLQTIQNVAIRARVVINAAGLYGDVVETICQRPSFNIKPRKGQFVVYSHQAGSLLNHIILPVPTERTKGVIIYPAVHGHLVIGPTAEDCTEREHPSLSPDITRQLTEFGCEKIPQLREHKIIATYAGIRPATESKDYHINFNSDKQWMTVGGIRSTGVSTCLALAQNVRKALFNAGRLRPSLTSHQPQSPGSATWWSTADGSTVIMDGISYPVTHPLSRLGYAEKHLPATPNSRI